MTQDDKRINKGLSEWEESEDEGGSSGSSTTIEFHDFLSTGSTAREDLSPQAERHLLAQHNETHEKVRVDKQKKARDRYRDVKNGKVSLETFRKERGGNQFLSHPLFEKMPVGADKQVDPSAVNEQQEANQDKKENKLTHDLRHRHQLTNQPTNTPTLRRT